MAEYRQTAAAAYMIYLNATLSCNQAIILLKG
jgi:hypothetical protein